MAPTIASQPRLLESGEQGMAGHTIECQGQVVDQVAIPTVVEIDHAGSSVMEQVVPLMQIRMDEPKRIRPLTHALKGRPHPLYHGGNDRARLWRTDRNNGTDRPGRDGVIKT